MRVKPREWLEKTMAERLVDMYKKHDEQASRRKTLSMRLEKGL